MNNEYSLKQPQRTRYFLSGILVVFLLLLAWRVSAQSENDSDWTDPINISLSGTAMQPSTVIAPSGDVLLFWQDRLTGYQYTQSNGSDWQPPTKVLVPFTEPPFSPVAGVDNFSGFYKPELIVDQNNILHAFWSGDEQRLLYSRAALLEGGGLGEWSPIQTLSQDVSGISVVVGPDNTLHLAYIQPSMGTAPSGVYYRYSTDNGNFWAEPQLLYQSDYLRSVDVENVNIKTAVNDDQVFVVWDDPLIEKVFVSHSLEQGANSTDPLATPPVEDEAGPSFSDARGVSWSVPIAVDQRLPDDEMLSPGPKNLDIVAKGEEIHLAWQGGHDQQQCVVYHQKSLDSGRSWEPVQKVRDTGAQQCSNQLQLFFGEDELLFLLTKIISPLTENPQMYLQAWDGEQWSDAALQVPLSSFINPQTFRQVDFDCHQSQLTPDNHLIVVGCGDEDIWGLERPLGDTTMWLWPIALSSAWSEPNILTIRDAPVHSPTMFVDDNDRIHIFWNEPVSEVGNQALFYMVQDRNDWSWPVPVLKSPEGDVRQASVTLDTLLNRFLATWIDSLDKNLYFSQVNVDAAAFVSDWSTPILLPMADSLSEWPQVLADMDGSILVIYEVPVNENRGVFMTRSDDGGGTWEDPVQIFDGTAANWSVVGRPVLSISEDGTYNLLLKRPLSLLDNNNDLFYLRSEDAGKTWSEPTQVNDQLVGWAQLVADSPNILHVVYQEQINDRMITRHTYSEDNGVTWTSPTLISDYEAAIVPTSLMSLEEGDLHIVFVGDSTLQYQWWNGTNWLIEEGKELNNYINATVALDSHMGDSNFDVIAFNEFRRDAVSGADETNEQTSVTDLSPLSFELSWLTYSLTDSQTQQEAVIVEQSTQTAEQTAITEALPTATLEQSVLSDLGTAISTTATFTSTTVPNEVSIPEQSTPNSYNPAFPWIVSIGIVLLLILIIFVIVIIRMRIWR